MTIRILVTGSREWTDRHALEQALWSAACELRGHFAEQTFVIVHGDCPTGADRMARDWATGRVTRSSLMRFTHEAHPADWDAKGKAAGPLRNQRMVDLGADLCLAFPTARSVGTWDCIKRANRAGIPVRIVPARG
jgi:hypothetical protein